MGTSRIESLEARCMFAAGAVDTSFGKNGSIVGHATAPGTVSEFPTAADAATQNDGKTIVVGNFVTRLALDGSLDTSYGNHGVVEIAADRVAIDSRGRAIVASDTGSAILIRRLSTSGKIDRTFGNDGVATIRFHAAGEFPGEFLGDIAIAPDGKIVVSGTRIDSNSSKQFHIAAERLLPDGRIDHTFGDQGAVSISADAGVEEANAVAIDSMGRVVMAGFLTRPDDTRDFAIVRLTRSGKLDRTFDGNGIAAVAFDGIGSEAHSLAIDSLGRYIVAGGTTDKHQAFQRTVVVRLLPNGAIDPTFTDGLKNSNFGLDQHDPMPLFNDRGNSVRLFNAYGGEYQLSVHGKILSTFGVSGVDSPSQLVAIDRRADGTFVGVISSSTLDDFGARHDLVRLRHFSGDGALTTTPADENGPVFLTSVGTPAVTVNGKLLFAGLTQTGVAYQQFNANGKSDTTFNGPDTRTERDASSLGLGTPILLPEGDGHIVEWTNLNPTPGADGVAIILARLNADGSADDYPVGADSDVDVIDPESFEGNVEVLPGGWVAATYTAFEGGALGLLIAPDGTVEYSSSTLIDENFSVSEVRPVGNTGKMVFAGDPDDEASNSVKPQLVRTNADGTFDKSFGVNGSVFGEFNLVAAQSNGGVLCGASGGIARLDHLGRRDKQFGDHGVAARGYSGVTFDSQDRIIGWKSEKSGDIQIARFTANGKPDKTFGGDGVKTIHLAVKGDVRLMITPKDDLVVTSISQAGQTAKWSATRILGS